MVRNFFPRDMSHGIQHKCKQANQHLDHPVRLPVLCLFSMYYNSKVRAKITVLIEFFCILCF